MRLNKKIKLYKLAVSARDRLESKAFKDTSVGRLKKRLFLLLFPGRSLHDLVGETISLCKRDMALPLDCCVNYGTPYPIENEITPKLWWEQSTTLPLGDAYYPAPGEYEKILTCIYGETWNQIPPDKLRYQHDEYQHSFWETDRQ